jgi:hypothetical protein
MIALLSGIFRAVVDRNGGTAIYRNALVSRQISLRW